MQIEQFFQTIVQDIDTVPFLKIETSAVVISDDQKKVHTLTYTAKDIAPDTDALAIVSAARDQINRLWTDLLTMSFPNAYPDRALTGQTEGKTK